MNDQVTYFPGPDIMSSTRIGRDAAWGHAAFRAILWDDGAVDLLVGTGATSMQLRTDAVQLHALSEMITDTLAAMRGEADPSDECTDEYYAILHSFNVAKCAPNRADMRALVSRIGWMVSRSTLEGAQEVTDHLDAAYEALGKCHAASADDGPLQADQRLDMAERAR